MKKTITFALAVCIFILCLTGCDADGALVNNNNAVIKTDTVHTDYEGVYLTLESVPKEKNESIIGVKWHNKSEYEVIYGKDYTIEYKEGERWVSTLTEPFPVIEIAYVLTPYSTQDDAYSTEYFDISKAGTYRLCKSFWVADDADNETYSTWVEFKVQPISSLKTHDITVKNPDCLYEPPKSSYKAGEEVVVKVSIVTDTGYLFLVNGKKIEEDPWQSGQNYWQFTFTMPDEDVTIDIKFYDGFLQYPNEALLIETYWIKNPEADHVRVRHYYGEYESGAIVSMIDAFDHTANIWLENVSGFRFWYNDGNRITVLYEGEFYTLKEAYEKGYLTDTDMSDIETKHRGFYNYLFPDDD